MSNPDNQYQQLPGNEDIDDEETAPSFNSGSILDGVPDSAHQRSIPKAPGEHPRLILYFMMIHFLLAFSELILVAPLIKLFEQSLCLSYYDLHDPGVVDGDSSVPEFLCKIQEVQAPLATIRGWKSMFDTIPVMLIAIPFGKFGDRYGRRKVLAIILLGVAASFGEIFLVCAFPRKFPLRLVWLSSIILLCGGGLSSAASCMWAMVSDSFSSNTGSHSVFYYVFSAFYVAELVGSFTAAYTLDYSPWIPCYLSLGALLFCLLLIWVMPEPRKPIPRVNITKAVQDSDGGGVPLLSSELRKRRSKINGITSALLHKNIMFTLPVFFTNSIRHTILNVLIQYGSNRFQTKISTGALFYTETAVVNITSFLIIVPILSSRLSATYNIQPRKINLYLVRICVCLLCLGSLLIGLSPSRKAIPFGVVVFAAGFGSRVSALALVSDWISDDSKATLFAAIAALENMGHAIGDPSLQQIFAATLRLHFSLFWQAMPFFFAAVLYFFAGVSTLFIDSREYM